MQVKICRFFHFLASVCYISVGLVEILEIFQKTSLVLALLFVSLTGTCDGVWWMLLAPANTRQRNVPWKTHAWKHQLVSLFTWIFNNFSWYLFKILFRNVCASWALSTWTGHEISLQRIYWPGTRWEINSESNCVDVCMQCHYTHLVYWPLNRFNLDYALFTVWKYSRFKLPSFL